MAVTYSLPSLKSRLVGNGGPVQFVTKADATTALDALRRAAEEAEEPLRASAVDGEDFLATSSFAPAPDGPIAFMHICDNAELLDHWLSTVARRLEAEGHAGRIAVLRSVESPRISAPAALAGISLNLDYDRFVATPYVDGNPPEGWWVDKDTSQRALSRLVQWCLDVPGDDVFVHAAAGFWLEPGSVEELVLNAVHSASRVLVHRVSRDGRSHRSLVCAGGGAVVCAVREESSTWAEHLGLLEGVLREVAPDAAHAFVRLSPPVSGLDSLWMMEPATPYVVERGWVHARMAGLAHLLLDYVPDAYVQQVVTTRQLDKITPAGGLPVGRWNVEELGAGRHLVTARNVEPWLDLDPTPYTKEDHYANRTPAPDAATLTQAREDFGPALLTYQMHQDHPRPEPERP